MRTSGEVSFFELGVADPERARAFYGELFGWDSSGGVVELLFDCR